MTRRQTGLSVAVALAWSYATVSCLTTAAAPGPSDRAEEFRQRAEAHFETARQHYHSSTNDSAAAWEFGRAAFDLAEFARNKAERESLAIQGIAACRRAAKLDPGSAPAHYYLALNLGQQARVHLLKGLSIVSEMEKTFLAARRLDPLYDYAGADRALGLLYHQAPGWPLSLGSQSKASQHLQEAAKLSPQYPGNRLALANFFLETRQSRLFHREWNALQELLPQAREEFSGPDWEWSWIEWDHRFSQIQARVSSN